MLEQLANSNVSVEFIVDMVVEVKHNIVPR